MVGQESGEQRQAPGTLLQGHFGMVTGLTQAAPRGWPWHSPAEPPEHSGDLPGCQAINFLTLAASKLAHNSEATDSVFIFCFKEESGAAPKGKQALPGFTAGLRGGSQDGGRRRGCEAAGRVRARRKQH